MKYPYNYNAIYPVALIGLMSSSALAQQQQQPVVAPTAEFRLSVTSQELDVISEGLQTQPFGKVAPIMQKLRQQIVDQQTAAQKPVDKVEPSKE